MKTSNISVITPNYNHGQYLSAMLNSTLSQNPHEVIVVDDASTDHSLDILQTYQKRYPNLRVIKNNSNLGVAPTVNKALQAATGDFLVFRSADDLTSPDAFAKSINMLQQHPSAGLVCGDLTHFFDHSPTQRTEPASLPSIPKYYSPEDTLQVLAANPIFGHTVMARASFAKTLGAYHLELKWYSDWFFFLTIALKHGFCYIPEPLAANRLRANSLGNATMANSSEQKNVLKAMIHIILSQYTDLVDAFSKSRIFENFIPTIQQLYQESPDLQTQQVQHLLGSALTAKSPPLKSGIARVINETLSQYSEQFKSFDDIYIYGAGSHTTALLNEWKKLNLPKITAILQTTANPGDQFQNLPILPINSLKPNQNTLIIISSKSFEEAMIHNTQPLNTKILTFWNTSATHL